MKTFFLVVTFLLYPALDAQTHYADSLKKRILIAKEDSNKVRMLNDLTDELKSGDLNQSILYAQEALVLAEKTGFKKGIVNALSNLGWLYGKLKTNPASVNYYERAEKAARETKNHEVLSNFYDAYSLYFEDQKDYRNAYKYHVLFSNAQDSLFGSMTEIKTQYETNMRQEVSKNLGDEDQLRSLTISQENNKRNILLIVCLFTGAIAALWISRMRLKRKEELSKELLLQQEIRAGSVIESEERERSRIARELHDGIGQQLSAAKLNISALQSFLKTATDADKLILQNTVDLLDDSVKVVRNVSHSMISNTLIKSGLISAIREFINKIGSVGYPEITLETVGTIDRLEHTKEAVLFRVMQEVIKNSIKHAGATKVSVQFIKHEMELIILVEDNGVGFDVESKLKSNNRIGLKSIQSRVAFLNGTVFFDSRPTRGTTVSIEIPM